MKWVKRLLLLLVVLLAGPVFMIACGGARLEGNWATADRSSAGLAPDPAAVNEAIVQVYAARAFEWRGAFAVHTWIAAKPRNADYYTVYEALGWRHWRGLPTVSASPGIPDRLWFGHRPWLLADVRGAQAEAAIPQIAGAVAAYPYTERYRVWPGPNSNTFTAWVVRRAPALKVRLPSIAIGKDFLGWSVVAPVPGGSGYQVSLYGLLGVSVGAREGLQINVMGLVFGLDPAGPAIDLPGVGRVGFGWPWPTG